MLLTGFDAPAFAGYCAGVNRIYPGKSHGFIVDSYGLSDYLTEALELFSTEDIAVP